MKINIIEETIPKESIPQIIKKILVVCREDEDLQKSKDIKDVESRISELIKKNEKNDELIEKSKDLKESLQRKLSILEDENESLRIQLLEKLGCEL